MRVIGAARIHELEVRRSRFICAVARCETERAAQEFIDGRRRSHRVATHNCTAYIVGDHGEIAKSNDDGEPSGTAGIPMLTTMKGRALTSTVAVVTRYFGGIKLGTGGLARAYAQAVGETIELAGTVERIAALTMTVTLGHAGAGRFQADLHASPYLPGEARYGSAFEIDVTVPEANAAAFTSWAAEVTAGEAVVGEGVPAFLERPS